MSDPAVEAALAKHGLEVPESAQLDACQWNYNSFHGNFKWRPKWLDSIPEVDSLTGCPEKQCQLG